MGEAGLGRFHGESSAIGVARGTGEEIVVAADRGAGSHRAHDRDRTCVERGRRLRHEGEHPFGGRGASERDERDRELRSVE